MSVVAAVGLGVNPVASCQRPVDMIFQPKELELDQKPAAASKAWNQGAKFPIRETALKRWKHNNHVDVWHNEAASGIGN